LLVSIVGTGIPFAAAAAYASWVGYRGGGGRTLSTFVINGNLGEALWRKLTTWSWLGALATKVFLFKQWTSGTPRETSGMRCRNTRFVERDPETTPRFAQGLRGVCNALAATVFGSWRMYSVTHNRMLGSCQENTSGGSRQQIDGHRLQRLLLVAWRKSSSLTTPIPETRWRLFPHSRSTPGKLPGVPIRLRLVIFQNCQHFTPLYLILSMLCNSLHIVKSSALSGGRMTADSPTEIKAFRRTVSRPIVARPTRFAVNRFVSMLPSERTDVRH